MDYGDLVPDVVRSVIIDVYQIYFIGNSSEGSFRANPKIEMGFGQSYRSGQAWAADIVSIA